VSLIFFLFKLVFFSLIYAYTQQKFIDEYESTVFDNYTASVTVNRRQYSLNLFDTTGQNQEKLSKLRIISYQNTRVVILCFSMVDPLSLDSCKRRWIPEVNSPT
jgi:small GTP-binding protein